MANKSKTQSNIFGKSRIFRGKVKKIGDNITLTFPAKVLDYIHSAGEIFWAPVNGVIMISGEKPHMVIPMISVNEEGFLPQENNPVVRAE